MTKYYLTFDYAMLPSHLEGKYPNIQAFKNGTPDYFTLNAYNGINGPLMFPRKPMPEETKALIAAWKQFIRGVICGNSGETYEYLRGWVGHLLRYPGKKNNVALCLRGESGSGKSVFFELLAAMLQAPYACQTNSIRDLAKNPAYVRNLLVNFDNVSFNDKLDAWLKARLEKPEQRWNGKDIKVYARYLLTTNDMTAFNAYLRHPRYFIVDVSWQKKDKAAYFANLLGTREKRERLKLAAPYLAAYFRAASLGGWDMLTRSPAKLIQAETRKPNHFKAYLYDILKGKVQNIYFWNANGFVFKKQIPWELYKGDITPSLFYHLLSRVTQRLETPSDWIYVRFSDLARDYSVRFYPEKLTLASLRDDLRSIFGYNVLQTKVLGQGVVAEWFCVNREMALDWIS